MFPCACAIACARESAVCAGRLGGRFLTALQVSTKFHSFHRVRLSSALMSISISSCPAPSVGMFSRMSFTTSARLFELSRLMPPPREAFCSKVISAVSSCCTAFCKTASACCWAVAPADEFRRPPPVDCRRAAWGATACAYGASCNDCAVSSFCCFISFCCSAICFCILIISLRIFFISSLPSPPSPARGTASIFSSKSPSSVFAILTMSWFGSWLNL
mmetsp:Transcript_17310/g.43083  ORF Transcript_17310/g.43083 Transcript_17310/m.43083 type:complete len:218 (+) Transcript_17310:623-1276(+)